jgi:hypothetical protein
MRNTNPIQKYDLFDGLVARGSAPGPGAGSGDGTGAQMPPSPAPAPPVAAVTPPATEPSPVPAPGGQAAPTPPSPALTRRIDELTAEKHSERRAREQAEARAKLAEDALAELTRIDPALARAPGGGNTPPPAPSGGDEARIQAEARRIAANERFDDECNRMVTGGRAAHPDFDSAIDGVRRITGPQLPRAMVEAVLATDAPAAVMYHLGKNPGDLDEVLGMPPLKMAVRLEKLASRLDAEAKAAASATAAPAGDDVLEGETPAPPVRAAPAVSTAPVPIRPRVSPGKKLADMPIDDPALPMNEFIKRRNDQESAARQAARR